MIYTIIWVNNNNIEGMRYRVLAVVELLCLVAVGCKSKAPKEELIEIEGVEQFELHPDWTEDNPEAFWE